MTFPFINTANASNLYRVKFLMDGGDGDIGKDVLSAYIDMLSVLAVCIVMYVFVLYIINGLFISSSRDGDDKQGDRMIDGHDRVGLDDDDCDCDDRRGNVMSINKNENELGVDDRGRVIVAEIEI